MKVLSLACMLLLSTSAIQISKSVKEKAIEDAAHATAAMAKDAEMKKMETMIADAKAAEEEYQRKMESEWIMREIEW